MDRSSRSTPTGPGSRGGRWHEPEFRRAYYRRWRANHPEYREREARRRRLRDGVDEVTRLTPGHLPVLVAPCSCECGCGAEMTMVCGLCRAELHEEAG